MSRRAWLYPVLITSLVLAIVAVLQLGNDWLGPAAGAVPIDPTPAAPGPGLLDVWRSNLTQPLALLLLQIFLIIAVARVFGYAARQFGQPSVIGEMAAGIVMGPSLFGAIAPGVFVLLFPPASLPLMNVLAQVGVIIFLFGVGLDFDWQHVKGRARAQPSSSATSASCFHFSWASSWPSCSTPGTRPQAHRFRHSGCSWELR